MAEIRTLLAYPNVTQMFRMIDADNYGTLRTPKIKMAEPIPVFWQPHFDVAEKILKETKDDFMYELRRNISKDRWRTMLQDCSYDSATEVWDIICSPCNEHDIWVLDAMGYSPAQITELKLVLNEYFDGVLSSLLADKGNC